jgi:WD40 repeat protein
MHFILFAGIILFVQGCNSRTPVEYDNQHDPSSSSYTPRKPQAPFDLRVAAVTNDGLSLAWQDTNTWSYVQRMQNRIVVEKSINNGPFVEVARVAEDITSLSDSGIDTVNLFRYRIRELTQHDTSAYSQQVVVQYTVVDAEITNVLRIGVTVRALTLSPDGTLLEATGGNELVVVWHVGDYTLIGAMGDRGGSVYTTGWPRNVAFSLDSKMIASNAMGVLADVWRVSDGELVKQITDNGQDYSRSICFSNDGSKILVGNYTGGVSIWDIASGALDDAIQLFPGSETQVNLLYLTRDGSRILVGGDGVQIRRSSDFSLIRSFSGFQAGYYSVSLDENYLTFGGSVLSLESGLITQSFSGYSGKSVLTYDDRFLVGQSADGSLYVGEVADGSIRYARQLSLQTNSYPAVVCLPNSYQFLAVGSFTGEIDLWSLKQGWTIQQSENSPLPGQEFKPTGNRKCTTGITSIPSTSTTGIRTSSR